MNVENKRSVESMCFWVGSPYVFPRTHPLEKRARYMFLRTIPSSNTKPANVGTFKHNREEVKKWKKKMQR